MNLKEQLSKVVAEYAKKNELAEDLTVDQMIAKNTSLGQTLSFLKPADFDAMFSPIENSDSREGEFTFTDRAPAIVTFVPEDKNQDTVHYPVFQVKNAAGKLFKISLGTMTKYMSNLDELGTVKITAKLSEVPADHNEKYGTTRVLIDSIK